MVIKKKTNVSKITIYKNWKKITQNSSPGESAKAVLCIWDHQDNTFQRSMESFQTDYCISLRNSENSEIVNRPRNDNSTE